MPALFIVAFVVIVIGIPVTIFGFRANLGPEDIPAAVVRAFGISTIVCGLVFFACCSIVINPTRTVAVVTSLGKPDDDLLRNGPHLVAPWETVHKFDTSLQTLELNGTGKDDSTRCVTVRLSNQSEACVDVDIQWNVDGAGDVVELYRTYKGFAPLEKKLVRPQTQRALNRVYQDFDPLSGLLDESNTPARTLDDLSAQAQTLLQEAVGTGIRIKRVTIHRSHYSTDTQRKLDAFQAELADTRIATQHRVTNEQTRLADEELTRSGASNDPGVKYRACLDLVRSLAEKDQLKNLPPTFTCGDGDTPPVIVDPNN